MNKVLFSHSYFLHFDPKQLKLQQPYPPLGTIWAAGLLRKNNYHVSLFDTMFRNSADELIPVLEKENPKYFVLYDDGFNYLTKMCLTNMRDAAFAMITCAKKQGCVVIVSSSDSSDHYKKYLSEGADFIVLGEAEHSLLELINHIESGKSDFENIKGIAFKKQENVHVSTKREVMRELDDLPDPAWDLIDIEKYRTAWIQKWGYFSLNMGTTRGCPFKCNWCAKPIYGNRYNSRSPRHVAEELKFLLKTYKPDHIWFTDDIFGLKPNWINEFSELVVKENLKFTFKIQSRVDLLLEDDSIKALAKAGCETVWVGAESGSQKILDAMDKGTRVEQIYETTALLKKHGIKPAFFLQFGYPGESKDDISKTIKMLNELLPDDIGVSVSYPLPGTKFHEKVKGDLKEKTNWTDSDELKLMFNNTYSSEFYRQLHRYVHKNYRKRQGYESIVQLLKNPFSVNGKKLKRAASVVYYVPATAVEQKRLKNLK